MTGVDVEWTASAITQPTTSELVAQLEAADNGFKRPAVPAVFAEYKLFLESGEYPYNDSVVGVIARKHQVGFAVWGDRQRFDHQAAHDMKKATGCDLIVKLHHEVYLASGQHRVEEMVAEERALADQGFHPITELAPAAGLRIRLLPGGTVYRCVSAGGGGWALMPPRARKNGVSLQRLVDEHEAYVAAGTAEQRVTGIIPRVRMYQEVGR